MSTVTLRVILDQVGDAQPTGVGRYATELTRALIETAPPGCAVVGVVPASPPADYDRINTLIPGLADLHKSALDRRQLAAAWQHGFTRLPGSGMIHAPSLFAPLARHDRINNPGEQIIVTVHDAAPFTHPESLPSRAANWHRAMALRAQRYADAIVVPTHAVADDLAEHLELGDRVRVISGAVSTSLALGDEAETARRADALDLPERYVLAVGPLIGPSGIPELMRSMTGAESPGIPLLLAGISESELAMSTSGQQVDTDRDHDDADGLGRVRALGVLDERDLAVVYRRATAVVVPALTAGTALVALEAMSLGAPVIHSDAPALVEVCDGAGYAVDRPSNGSDLAGDAGVEYGERLAAAVRALLDDPQLAETLAIRGRDRAKAFSWRDSAEKTWQLHADL
jgi:glycosyltransferase involved in cell wall biosynthesis